MIIVTLIIAFLIAVLSGIGVGGGGLFVIYLSLFTDTPHLAAQGINLVFFLFSAGSSLLVHLSKRKIFVTAVIVMTLAGLVGAVGGALLSGYVEQSILRKTFGAMLIVSGMLSLRNALSGSRAPLLPQKKL